MKTKEQLKEYNRQYYQRTKAKKEAYYKNNREEILKRFKANYKPRPRKRTREEQIERERQIRRKYYHDNKEKIKIQSRIWREHNKEVISNRMKKYYQKNREKLMAQHNKYNRENAEKLKIYRMKYCQENREKMFRYREILSAIKAINSFREEQGLPTYPHSICNESDEYIEQLMIDEHELMMNIYFHYHKR